LSASVVEVGFLQPIVVRSAGDGFELVAGERRLRAAAHAGLATIPALVRETADDALLRDALLENLHRVQLNPLEEAAAYQQLLEDFGCTQEELATRLGKSRPAVTNSIRLLRLPSAVQRRVAAGVLSAGHARALVALNDPKRAEELATRVVAEGMSVRALEELIALGQDENPERKRRSRRSTSSPHPVTEEDLASRLDTKVKITGTARRGKIAIEYGSVEDFDRIMSTIKDPRTWGG
jgi:ParB family chromosome partitioning protein